MSSSVITEPRSLSLSQQYTSVRKHSELLCAPLHIEDYIPQPVDFVSPPKWHLAHTTWFFETFVLKKYQDDYKVYHEDFSFLFNSYYNAVGDRVLRATRGNLTRPGVEAIYAYRKYVDEHMTQFISEQEVSQELQELIVLGLNHEQQHQELLITDLKYIFGHNPIWPVYRKDFSLVGQYNQHDGFVKVSEGIYEIGFEGTGFHWDNELGRHKVYLQPYEISSALVTNGEYMEFINDGGYERFELWLDEGWSWVNQNEVKAPLYWHRVGEDWKHYTLSGFKVVDPDQVLCHINFFEAAAFAEWKGMRLPTEFEWEAAADQLNWGQRWEWTNSAYLPYPDFAKAPGAIGEYNGKFMVNQMVLRGGSTATSPKHSRKTYRNFFHTHLGWQCTGIRLCK
ncbi:MAG: ergothioneine biosynthesis protein EgtB [Bacteroidota bacterium]